MNWPQLIKNVRVWTGNGFSDTTDVFVDDGVIVDIRPGLTVADASVVEGKGSLLLPGLVDLHARVGEPGNERRETVQSLLKAGAAGGFTHVVIMPDTDPPVDSPEMVSHMLTRPGTGAGTALHVTAALTRNREGELLTDLAHLSRSGAVAFGDGQGLPTGPLMRNALQYARMFEQPVFATCDRQDLTGDGVAVESELAARLGLRLVPQEAETAAATDVMLTAEAVQGRVHLQHVSAASTVDMVRLFKSKGVDVTAEAAFFNLIFSEHVISNYAPETRVVPALRPEDDRLALIEGLKDGTIDCIVTRHTPLTTEEHDVPFEQSLPGTTGLETALSAVYTHLVLPGLLTWDDVIRSMSTNPRRIIGLEPVTLAPGSPADLTVFDPEAHWSVDGEGQQTIGVNNILAEHRLQGSVLTAIYGGKRP